MGMKASDFDRRVQVLRSGLVDDGYQTAEGEYRNYGSAIAASRRDISDGEKLASGAVLASLDTRFRVRSSAFTRCILPSDRLRSEGRIFEILGIKEVEGRFALIEITCTARVL